MGTSAAGITRARSLCSTPITPLGCSDLTWPSTTPLLSRGLFLWLSTRADGVCVARKGLGHPGPPYDPTTSMCVVSVGYTCA